MERPLKELKLPESGFVAKIATFLTRGEVKTIDAKRLDGAEAEYIGDEVKISKLSPNMIQRQNDALLLVGVKELFNEKKEVVELTEESLDSLPNKDANLLLKELREVQAGAKIPSKKK